MEGENHESSETNPKNCNVGCEADDEAYHGCDRKENDLSAELSSTLSSQSQSTSEQLNPGSCSTSIVLCDSDKNEGKYCHGNQNEEMNWKQQPADETQNICNSVEQMVSFQSSNSKISKDYGKSIIVKRPSHTTQSCQILLPGCFNDAPPLPANETLGSKQKDGDSRDSTYSITTFHIPENIDVKPNITNMLLKNATDLLDRAVQTQCKSMTATSSDPLNGPPGTKTKAEQEHSRTPALSDVSVRDFPEIAKVEQDHNKMTVPYDITMKDSPELVKVVQEHETVTSEVTITSSLSEQGHNKMRVPSNITMKDSPELMEVGQKDEKMTVSSDETITSSLSEGEQEHIKTINLSGKSLLKVKGVARKKDTGNLSIKQNCQETVSKSSDHLPRGRGKRKMNTQFAANEECNLINKQFEDIDPDPTDGESDEQANRDSKRKRIKPEECKDVTAFKINKKSGFWCWVCQKKFAQCVNVKKHILENHDDKALCALSEDIASQHLQLLLFCPKNCNFITSQSDTLCTHLTSCPESEMELEGRDLVEEQTAFLSQEYIWLQDLATSSADFGLKRDQHLSSQAGQGKKGHSLKMEESREENEDLTVCDGNGNGPTRASNPHPTSGYHTEENQKAHRPAAKVQTNAIHCCHECFMVFPTWQSLQHHMGSQHGEEKDREPEKGDELLQEGEEALKGEETVSGGGDAWFICQCCSKSFSTISYLLSHMRVHKQLAEARAFKCDKCDKSFNRAANLITHMRIHTGEKPFMCSECGRCFSTTSNILVHMRIHTGEKPYQCKDCDKSFSRRNDLKTHIRIHTGEKPFKCEVCGQSFRTNSNILNHMRTHTGEKPYICRECGKTFSRSGDLLVHGRMHSGERPFRCDECGHSYKTNWNLLLHTRTHTGEKRYNCEVCGKNFYRSNELRIHLRIHTGEKPFHCQECGSTFIRSSDLQVHMRTHTGTYPFQCDMCDKTFSRNIDLTNHVRSHTGERPFSCEECGKSFSRSGSLNKHMVIHTRDTPFTCNICSKSFGNSDQLISHMRMHTGERPFACADCDKSFTQSYQLTRHMRLHGKRRQFECRICRLLFTGNHLLIKHMRTHAGESDLDRGLVEDTLTDSTPQLPVYVSVNPEDEQFQCAECGKVFMDSTNLKKHMRIHIGEKCHECGECGKAFHQRCLLTRHMRTHLGEKKVGNKEFTCLECGKIFKQSSKLEGHMRTHTGERPFSCSECGKTFNDSGNLTRHMRRHTGEKPFECNECGHRFAQSFQLHAHRKVHTYE